MIDDDPADAGLVTVSVVAALAGLVVGVVAGSFRWCLVRGDDLRGSIAAWADRLPGPGWIVVIAMVAAASAAARLIVRREPAAAGSGIQDVEAAWRGDADVPTTSVLVAKFTGGLLAIGSGLALGREGPTVHMGAVVGAEAGRRFRRSEADIRLLQTALGGAGLAVAFNAPLGGALFVFEEVARSFRPRLALATLIACASAIAVSRIILEDAPEFDVGPIPTPHGWHLVVFVVFGLLVGLLGALYDRVIVGCLRLSDRMRRVGPEVQAALIGAAVGVVLLVEPLLAGDGAPLVQRLLGSGLAVGSIAGFLCVRFVIGPVSYAAGTPGGLFAPLLVVGALTGVAFHRLAGGLPGAGDPRQAYIVVGMAAFFAAVVRAPFTGVVLVVEMTANTTLIVPLFAACFAAVLASTLVGSVPIYDSLWMRVIQRPSDVRSGPQPESPD